MDIPPPTSIYTLQGTSKIGTVSDIKRKGVDTDVAIAITIAVIVFTSSIVIVLVILGVFDEDDTPNGVGGHATPQKNLSGHSPNHETTWDN